jgi:hypothetical protein
MQLLEWAHVAIAQATDYASSMQSSPSRLLAALAAVVGVALVVAGSLARTMMPLRWLAVGSGVAMVTYGALQPSPITLILEAVLLPINVYRAFEVTLLTRRVKSAQADAELASLWLKPYMAARSLKAGQALFLKGDSANALYLLVDGTMELEGIGKLETGRIFGEIGLFSKDRKRTRTVRCVTDCRVLEIQERTVKQLYFQHPAFGFHLIELLVGRLSADIERGETTLARLKGQ